MSCHVLLTMILVEQRRRLVAVQSENVRLDLASWMGGDQLFHLRVALSVLGLGPQELSSPVCVTSSYFFVPGALLW